MPAIIMVAVAPGLLALRQRTSTARLSELYQQQQFSSAERSFLGIFQQVCKD